MGLYNAPTAAKKQRPTHWRLGGRRVSRHGDEANCDAWLTPVHLESKGLRDELKVVVSTEQYDLVDTGNSRFPSEDHMKNFGVASEMEKKQASAIQRSAASASDPFDVRNE